MQTGNEQYKCFRSCISVSGLLVFFILALATLQSLIVMISEIPQNVYGQTQATVTDINIVNDLSWSPSLDSNLKPTTSSVVTIAASISDNGNNSSTPFLLPSPSSSQPSGNNNNSSSPTVGPASNTSPSNNIVNSDSPSQGHNSNKENSTNTHHNSPSSSQTNIVSSNYNHVENEHKKHKHGSTVDIINQVVSQSKQQFSGGEIPFP